MLDALFAELPVQSNFCSLLLLNLEGLEGWLVILTLGKPILSVSYLGQVFGADMRDDASLCWHSIVSTVAQVMD